MLSIFRASGEVVLASEEVDAALVRVDIFDVFTCVLLVRVEVDTVGVHAVAGLAVDPPRPVLGVFGAHGHLEAENPVEPELFMVDFRMTEAVDEGTGVSAVLGGYNVRGFETDLSAHRPPQHDWRIEAERARKVPWSTAAGARPDPVRTMREWQRCTPADCTTRCATLLVEDGGLAPAFS